MIVGMWPSELTLFLQASVVGVSIAAPVGPIGLLTIQRTLTHGVGVGLATGLGAALADACYGAVGALGVGWLIERLAAARLPLAWAGAALLLVLAWRTWRASWVEAPAHAATSRAPAGVWWRSLGSSFALTLANPATILSFVAVFGVLGASAPGPVSPWTMVGGVFAGSAAWWLLLCGGVGWGRRHLTPALRRGLNRVSALMLAGFALGSLALALAA